MSILHVVNNNLSPTKCKLQQSHANGTGTLKKKTDIFGFLVNGVKLYTI